MTERPDADLVVIGAGPAGCAAVVMAESLNVATILVDPAEICAKLTAIPILDNVLGGFTTGAALAEKAAEDVHRSKRCTLRLGERAAHITVDEHRVSVLLQNGETLTARGLVLATGVAPVEPAASRWISLGHGVAAPQLTSLAPRQLDHRSVLILGADRPLGTLLRAHPRLDVRFTVAYPQSDRYKTDEVRTDPRVTLIPAQHIELTAHDKALANAVVDGEMLEPHDLITSNIGTTPVSPTGPLVHDELGYCPIERQHARIHVAGDLRSARGQRIMTAMGSGAEAALRFYYNQQRE